MSSVFVRCPECGTVNPKVNNFCGHCGLPLVDVSSAVAPEAPSLPVSQAAAFPIPEKRNMLPEATPTFGGRAEAAPVIVAPALAPERAIPVQVEEPIPARPRFSSDPAPGAIHEVETPEAVSEEEVREPVALQPVHGRTTISGPSFLGLTDNSDFDQTSYLLEEERSSRRGGWVLFAVVAIIVFAAIGWLEWNSIKTGRLNIPFLKSAASDPQPKPAPSTAQNSAASPSNDNVTSGNSDSSADNKFTTTEPGADIKPSASETAAGTNPSQTKPATAPPATPSENAAPQPPPAEPDEHSASSEGAGAKGALSHSSSAATKPTPNALRADAEAPEADPHTNKMLLLGEKYLYGRGVPKSCNQALVYFRAAADEENAPAMSHLGAMYASGNCVPMNRATAYSWFARAGNADPKNQWLTRNMNMLWRDMTPQERAAINR